MTVTITITFVAAEGRRDALVDQLRSILPDTRAFNGCESITFAEADGAPGSFILVEDWGSLANYDAYKTWRVESKTTVLGSDLVAAGTPVTTVYERLD